MRSQSLSPVACVGLFLILGTSTTIPSSTAFVTPSAVSSSVFQRGFENAWDTKFSMDGSTRQMTSSSTESEKELRREIADRNSKVENEEQYAILDGAGMGPIAQETPKSSDTDKIKAKEELFATEESEALQKKLDRLIKQRPYPLFLMEKAAEIVEDVVGDIFGDDTSTIKPTKREKVVVLGTGWGAAAFLKGIDTNMYDVTVISPRNYFVFTPMLAGASVGTVDFRSITEPVREINRKATYLEGTATEVDTVAKRLTCESVICDGNSCDIQEFSVEYDRLIVTIGAQTNTFGIPGVREYCNFLKQIEDARRIRTAIVNCFERATLPGMSDEERERNLTFAIIGAGPTGIEFAAELRDFVEQDGPKYYPNLLKHVRIKVIEASSTVLAPFDKSLQEEAIARMKRSVQVKDPDVLRLLPERFELVELLLESSVKEVTAKTIFLNNGLTIDYGLSVWAAGNGPLPLTLQLVEKLGEEQASEQNVARGRIVTDAWMRAKGSNGSIMALGDCSCTTKGPDGPLPATGQVAAQQGEFLAKLMNKGYDLSPTISKEGIMLPPVRQPDRVSSLSDNIANLVTGSDEYAKPFQFLNLGILAYTGGGSALAQVATAPNAEPIKGKGKIGNALWKSVYISKQVSWRNRFMVINDWLRRQIFGRDITRL
ncbi:pyridine nucleotide-disulfide oxidoreductase [Nitzschia inconspicua]|uniref:NADH:ubiquinone reductase (non-electrogenic) n=1 Tax=Nitzschia inconspicua TaxID=303405 RepID=A0A9K3PMG0_9STRA|nr:pyridine nucleotide-disulfide oxidoreductase [Nitzschia inconspicua]KAG7352136.1 pyridine nucleotide-disulfide oxidoreductase [Nitzschia inconspicua]